MEDEIMKKRSLIVAALCSMCLALGNPLPVMADASKVVTLGADLTDEQKNTMMKYFKADANQVQIITVNNVPPMALSRFHSVSLTLPRFTGRHHSPLPSMMKFL